MIDYIKLRLLQFWNILIGKDENWDGVVDIKDNLIKAEKKTENESKSA